MSNTGRVDFLYLDEPSMIKAGVKDMHACMDVIEECYHLLGNGDYVMGGKNHDSHGVKIVFPKTSPFPNMPLEGPDRRFMAMVAYVGGRFNVAGEKWYGSNTANKQKNLPRSILMVMLNDADTGAPIALMSGNLISGMRTGAVPGVAARYLARKDAKVCGLIGSGPINRSCFMSIVDALPELEEVKIFDVFPEYAEKMAAWILETYPQIKKAYPVDSTEAAVRDADIVNSATSGKNLPYINGDWIKKGALISLPAGIEMDQDFLLRKDIRKIIDNWGMYEAWSEELPYPWHDSIELVGAYYLDWIKEGAMTRDEITNLGEIVNGKVPGRQSDDEIIIFGQGGLPIYDVAWGKQIYDNAVKMGLGIKLNLWEEADMH
ncbi:MAG: ornithine cyclodeaminase [Lachnospiraceae bacterium]|nr:ornithine cyclodeaminase [Lachnospiraceae bacterium]